MSSERGHIIEPGSTLADTAIPFNFNDVRQMAGKLLKAANDQAQRLLETARAQAVEIEKTAYEDGFEKGREAGYPKGVEDGRASGEQVIRQEVIDATGTMAQALEEMIDFLAAERLELRTEAEVDLLSLSLAIARRVVKHDVTAVQEAVIGNVHEAVGLTVSRRDIQLKVNPLDLAAVEAYLPNLKAKFNDLERVSVVADQSVTQGGVIAATTDGEVDLRIEEQFAALERALIGEGESIVIEPVSSNVPSQSPHGDASNSQSEA